MTSQIIENPCNAASPPLRDPPDLVRTAGEPLGGSEIRVNYGESNYRGRVFRAVADRDESENRIVNVEPSPGLLETLISPLWLFTMP